MSDKSETEFIAGPPPSPEDDDELFDDDDTDELEDEEPELDELDVGAPPEPPEPVEPFPEPPALQAPVMAIAPKRAAQRKEFAIMTGLEKGYKLTTTAGLVGA